MVIAAGGPGLLVRVAALAGADRSGSRLCHTSTAPARGLTIVVVRLGWLGTSTVASSVPVVCCLWGR